MFAIFASANILADFGSWWQAEVCACCSSVMVAACNKRTGKQGMYRDTVMPVAMSAATWCLCRIPFPIKTFSPSGYIDTLYLDDDLRVSKGDKGSIFIARRAEQQE